jgi:hypothetical protein
MKITKTQLRQIIKEELQTELFGLGKKKGPTYKGNNAKALVQALIKIDRYYHKNPKSLGDYFGEELIPALIGALEEGTPIKLPSKSKLDNLFRDYYGKVAEADPEGAKVLDAFGGALLNIADKAEFGDEDMKYLAKIASQL